MKIDMKNTMFYISSDKEDSIKVTALIKTKQGVVPYEIKKPTFISSFPLLMQKLKEGKIIYLNSSNGYIGEEKTEGPYCEEQIFISEYDDNNGDFLELLSLLEQKVKSNKTVPKKLVKIGSEYK